MRTRALALALICALAAVAPHASAQTHACAAEAAKLCPGVSVTHGALIACLKPHDAELSDPCRRNIAHIESKQQTIRRRRPQVNTVRSAQRTPSPTAVVKVTPAK